MPKKLKSLVHAKHSNSTIWKFIMICRLFDSSKNAYKDVLKIDALKRKNVSFSLSHCSVVISPRKLLRNFWEITSTNLDLYVTTLFIIIITCMWWWWEWRNALVVCYSLSGKSFRNWKATFFGEPQGWLTWNVKRQIRGRKDLSAKNRIFLARTLRIYKQKVDSFWWIRTWMVGLNLACGFRVVVDE